MEIKIGVTHIGRELTIETDGTADDVQRDFQRALLDGDLLTLKDRKGRTLMIPTERIAYLDLGQENARPVGFGSV